MVTLRHFEGTYTHALQSGEERLLMVLADRHEDMPFKLTQIDIPCYRPYALKGFVENLVGMGLVEVVSPGDTWRLTQRGLTLADLLSGIHLWKIQAAKKAEEDNIANPKRVERLRKNNKWQMSHHYEIAALREELLATAPQGDGTDEDMSDGYEIENEQDEYFVTGVYTDGEYTLSLGVSLKDIRDGKHDPRFTHVLVIFPNAEDK